MSPLFSAKKTFYNKEKEQGIKIENQSLNSNQNINLPRSQSNENDKTGIFDRFFFNYKFLCVKIVANTNKKI